MNYIVLFIVKDEKLRCSCGHFITSCENAFLTNYIENTLLPAFVRCEKCFKKAQVEKDIILLEGILGQ